MASAGKILRTPPEEKVAADKQGAHVAGLISEHFQLGDFVIIDTKDTSKHVGFYGGLIRNPKLVIALASTFVEFENEWDMKYLDHIHFIPVNTIMNFKAAPTKQE